MDASLQQRALDWIAGDPDPSTRDELRSVLDRALAGDAAATGDLHDRLDGRLPFGTAGLRGAVGAGSNRMNLAVVLQAAWGLAQVVGEDHDGDGPAVVVVGNDARPDSPRFAAAMAEVLAAAGLAPQLVEAAVPTPVLAWLARDRRAAAALVVTASHNPPADNGVKVYDERAVQIVAPTDRRIAAAIARAPAAADIARDVAGVARLDAATVVLGHRRTLVPTPRRRREPGLRIVATALHGVGADPLVALLGEAGHGVEQVAAQRAPDGRFPTVAFPNPEEPGALDLVLALAGEREADLVLANDPDADRLAVALPDGSGGHRALTGNEVAALLADGLLSGDVVLPPAGPAPAGRAVVATSIVTSPQVREVTLAHGAEHRWTLTGFKWIWTALLDAERAGHRPVLGAEEALGYAVHPAVRDKDGLSAALAVVELAAAEAERGRTLWDRLDDVVRSAGLWASVQQADRLAGVDAEDLMRGRIAGLRGAAPDRLAGLDVTDVVDWALGADQRPPWLGAQDLLEHRVAGVLADGAPIAGRALVRPSGTEPKLKAYVDLQLATVDQAAPRARAGELREVADAVARALLDHGDRPPPPRR